MAYDTVAEEQSRIPPLFVGTSESCEPQALNAMTTPRIEPTSTQRFIRPPLGMILRPGQTQRTGVLSRQHQGTVAGCPNTGGSRQAAISHRTPP